MAITINIYYKGINGNARKFANDMILSGIVEDIRNEDGNLRYDYFYPIDDQETVLLIDSWKDESSLDIHHASPMMQKIIKLRDQYDLHMVVEKYISADDTTDSKNAEFIRK